MTVRDDLIQENRVIAQGITPKNAPKHAACNFLGCPDSLKNQPAPAPSEYMDENHPDYPSESERIVTELLKDKKEPKDRKPIIVVLAGAAGVGKSTGIEKLRESDLVGKDIRDALTNGALISNDAAKMRMKKYQEDIAKGKVAASVLPQRAAALIAAVDTLTEAQNRGLDILCEEPYTDRKRIHDIIKQFGATHEIVFIGFTCSLEKAAQRTIDRALAGERKGHFILRSYFEKSFRDAAQCLRYNLRALPSTVRKYVFDTTTDKLKPLDVKKIDQLQCAEINQRKMNPSKITRIVTRIVNGSKFPSKENNQPQASSAIPITKNL